ncbi:hypothetical protein [Candidatus Colwellia aromaticivorans]|uniref:hypothetical protein n=1 Tax=Candidatus Colwellia aromaticivorans TaxID=2267621 RepID=UPI000DF489AD|nr:hypothetical protein [Candidatus Colwellia aromaticivorans]
MLSKNDKVISVKATLNRIVPKLKGRTWIVDYSYRHKIGNKLPRGKRYKNYKQVEKKEKWISHITNDHSLINFYFKKQISPLLLSQLALLRKATIYKECQLNTQQVFEVIKWLEGEENVPPSTKLSKNPKSFSGGCLLKNYEHIHAPMLPNAYMEMMEKPKNIERIVNNLSDETGKIDLKKVESEILKSGKNKAGRQTGHWLITRMKNGIRYYLGVFPHDYSFKLIHEQLLESQRLLNLKN